VPAADPPPSLSTIEDGRLDELAARYGMTIREVRRVMGHQHFARPRPEVDPHAAVAPAHEPDACMPPPPREPVTEDPAALDDGRLDELAASLGVTIGDVRRMVELTRRRTYRTYRGRLDVDEVRRRYEAGESLAGIGEVLGVSGTTVRHAMIRAGIPRRPGPRPAGERRGPLRHLDVDEIRRRWEAGETVVEIAQAIGASRGGVRLALDRVGIDRRSQRR
jgi:hypothetical protein